MTKPERKSYLTALSYRLFGGVASRVVLLKQAYEQSGLSRLYESYVALMLFASLVTFVLVFVVGVLFHYFVLKLGMLQVFEAVIPLSMVASLVVSMVFFAYPLYRRDQRKKEIDTNLVYTAGYMGVLAAGGISAERIFERVIQVERRVSIRDLARRFIANIRVFGLDVVSSLDDVSRHSPSEVFSKLLVGMTNTLKTSGDMKSLLTFETERLLHAKREQLKKILNTLLGLGEVYIAGVVMGPITFIVMITILSIMGNVAFGISPVMQLNLIVFFGIPMISLVFIVVLNSFLPGEE
jgi:archaellum biogenesis protein FlaJ (TadC family)